MVECERWIFFRIGARLRGGSCLDGFLFWLSIFFFFLVLVEEVLAVRFGDENATLSRCCAYQCFFLLFKAFRSVLSGVAHCGILAR